MKKVILVFFLTILSCHVLPAQDITPKINVFLDDYGKDNIAGMDKTANEIITEEPDNYVGYAFKGYTAILKNDLATAEKYMTTARHMNPIDQGSYGVSSYIAFLKGNTEEAKRLMNLSFQLRPDEGLLKGTLDDVAQIERITSKNLSELKILVNTANSNTKGSPAIVQKYYACFKNWNEGKECGDLAMVKAYFAKQQPQNALFSANTDYLKATSFYFAQNYDAAKVAFNSFLNNPALQTNDTAYSIAQAYFYLSFYDDYNAEKVFINAEKGLTALEKIPFPTLLKCQLLDRKMIALGNLGKGNEQIQIAQKLFIEAKKVSFPYMEAKAYNSLGAYYVVDTKTENRQKAYGYLKQAYDTAKMLNDEKLINSIATNYAIALWQQGKKQEAIQINANTYESLLKNKQYADAQLAANNLGFMSFMQKDFSNAAVLFKKSVAITEKYRSKLSSAQKLAVMNEHSSAYGGLIMSLQKLNNVSELFSVQDLNRSRLLRDNLNIKTTPKSLAETQKMLDDDEVLLYYSQAGPGEMVVSIITKSTASIGYNFPIDSWLKVKKEFLNRVNKKPNNLNNYVLKLDEEVIDGKVFKYNDKAQAFNAKDYNTFVTITQELLQSTEAEMKPYRDKFLRQWYDFLIKPIENKIAGKKTLIISGEGHLNYLPFETFLNEQNKYLIQKYNVKYIPSVTVWSMLQNRNFPENRKSIFAMGGATYNPPPPKDYAPPRKSIEEIFAIHDDIEKKINANQSDFSRELKALNFGGAAYLKGTLAEVQAIKAIIPEGTILTGDQMRESNLKKLDKEGELANYKWIHLATHGFALDNIPEFSGVMMTQPSGGDGKEDMFLLAHEIAKLNIKADLAVLSACETALGKIYGGEGVNGLNSAFLTAGANNTLLSLWPVSDDGTKLFMTLVYYNLYAMKMTVEEGINTAKRDMISGKHGAFMKEPGIWAPFVLNGK
jgi:CHAT domain-containing protein